MKFVFFGGSEFSVHVLEELKLHNILPSLIITTPDKPKGRKLVLTPTPVKIWAQNHNIEVIDPVSLKKDNSDLICNLKSNNYDLFLVASYGKIIPKEIFDISEKKTLNIHPSLLPKYRGASPIQSQILNDEKEIGVTIMQIDEEMDHGPVVVQTSSRQIVEARFAEAAGSGNDLPTAENKIPSRKELEKVLAIDGARLFAHILPEWLQGSIDPIMQDESKATYCQKIEKENGELQIDLNDLSKNARENYLKIKAFEEWPTTYFFLNEKRIIITDANFSDNKYLK